MSDEQPVPAGAKEMLRLQESLVPTLSNLLKTIADGVGHVLLDVNDVVYQYTSVSGLKGMVESHSIWTTPVCYLNDASEYLHGQHQFEEIMRAGVSGPENGDTNQVFNYVLACLKSNHPNSVFVACFSPNRDQLSQWRGYAADGYGYAVGLDTAKFDGMTPTPMVLNVLYQKDKQQQFSEQLVRQGIMEIAQILVKADIEPSPEAVGELLSFAIRIMLPGFKHDGFAEEKEFRLFLIRDYDAEATNSFVYHERRGLLIPHIPVRWASGKLPIKEVIVGPNLNFEHAKWSLTQFLHQYGYTDVDILPSKVPYIA